MDTSVLEERVARLERQLRWRSRALIAVILVATLAGAKNRRELVVDSLTVTGDGQRVTIADGALVIESRAPSANPGQVEPLKKTTMTAGGLSVSTNEDTELRLSSLALAFMNPRGGPVPVTQLGRDGLLLGDGKSRSFVQVDRLHLESPEGAVRSIDLDKQGLRLLGRENEVVHLRRDSLTRELPDGGVVELPLTAPASSSIRPMR